MARYIKKATGQERSLASGVEVRQKVESILEDIRRRGDEAVRELSIEFDSWNPPSFLLTREQSEECLASLAEETVNDIKFAQEQVRTFAQHQRATIRDLEVETLPGVVLGHKNIPVSSVGCYVPGGRYPMVASAHMSVVTARTAGVDRHHRGYTTGNQGHQEKNN